MVIVDTSAWIEYFNNGEPQTVVRVESCLERELVAMGDLIYCEVLQGIKLKRERDAVASLLLSLPQFDMVGFQMAEKSADNYRLLRSQGVSIRKTIDVLIGTFCVEHGFQIIHHDKDFDVIPAYRA
jgi:predicted nucleic acid-binding protein